MDNKLKPITVDSRPFSELIRGGYLYVDKTRYIYSLVENGSESKYWFLSRPRRQGKSLLVDILYNLFSGNKDQFKGLYIYEEYSFERFPVIRLNLNNTATYSLEAFLDSLKRDVVFPVAKAYGVEASFPFDAVSPSSWLNYLISSISEKFEKQVVILIDEYDYPLLDSINNSIFEDIRVRLESFYSVLKARISDIKFCFITGITRFSQVSIFFKTE